METPMKITRDVINDLLPVYLAGDASADTRALLEEYLRTDPSLAADVRAHADKSTALMEALGAAVTAGLPGDQEKAALEKIRSYTRYRNQFFAFGLAFALMPFAFMVSDGELQWIMLRDSPKQAALFLVASAYCWISRAVIGRRIRT
jgi:anti-sigma factor RsiW